MTENPEEIRKLGVYYDVIMIVRYDHTVRYHHHILLCWRGAKLYFGNNAWGGVIKDHSGLDNYRGE